MVRATVEETLNGLLDTEADRLCGARKYERTEGRKDTRATAMTGNLTPGRRAMKKMIAIAVFAAGFLATTTAPAQSAARGHLQTIQHGVPPVSVMTVCAANRVN